MEVHQQLLYYKHSGLLASAHSAFRPGAESTAFMGKVLTGGRYTVQEGDTFGSIAQQLSLLGRRVTPYELIKYNYNIDPQRIRPGQVLVVPTVRDMPELTRIQTWQGNVLAIAVLAIAALSLVAHNFYLGVLIFQQPDSTFRKAFALGSNVFATTATICLGYHDHLKRCKRAIAYVVQRASSGVAQHAPEQNTFLFLFNMCVGCPNVDAESLINPDAQSLWYWFSDGHALLEATVKYMAKPGTPPQWLWNMVKKEALELSHLYAWWQWQ
ncbi:hypothetical protein ABBQ38_005410 [Trebouxia sp. C0009 RCD-2024]